MRVRWTTKAAGDLAHIVQYIRKDNPTAARRVAETIFGSVAGLRTFPHRGRIGLAQNTRELVFTPWPYIAVYEIIDDKVQVLVYATLRKIGRNRSLLTHSLSQIEFDTGRKLGMERS